MAAVLWRIAGESVFVKSVLPCINMIPVRYKTHRKFPTRKRINPFVKLRTDLIKRLVLALVQHERIQTTHHKALQLKKYGDLVRAQKRFLRIPSRTKTIFRSILLRCFLTSDKETFRQCHPGPLFLRAGSIQGELETELHVQVCQPPTSSNIENGQGRNDR